MPHQGDKELFEKTGNHIPLCATCHNTVTGKFDMRYVAGEGIENKTEYLSRARAYTEATEGIKLPPVKVIPFRQ